MAKEAKLGATVKTRGEYGSGSHAPLMDGRQGTPSFPVYETWEAFLATFESLPSSATWGSATWAGAGNLGDTLKLAREGWAAGRALIQSAAMPLVAATAQVADSTATTWAWDVTGSDYDVGEYLTGAPECWLARRPPPPRPVVRVLVNVAVSAGVPAEAFNARGAAVAALALALQEAGIPVEVSITWAIASYGGPEPVRAMRVKVSDPAGGPLDLDRLMFSLAHPSVGRQLGHMLVGSGMPTDDLPWEDVSVYLPCMHVRKGDVDWKSPDSVREWTVRKFHEVMDGTVKDTGF